MQVVTAKYIQNQFLVDKTLVPGVTDQFLGNTAALVLDVTDQFFDS